MKNQDERRFTDVVDTIDKAEKDVDKVLDAARLNRHEGPQMRLNAEQKFYLLMALMAMTFFLALFLTPMII